MARDETYEVEITSAVVLDGKIVVAGRKVAVDGATARNLLQRGKAEIAAGAPAPERRAGPIGTDGSGDAPDAAAPLAEHTVAELREIAAGYDIEGAAQMKKADLIAAIEAAEQEDDAT